MKKLLLTFACLLGFFAAWAQVAPVTEVLWADNFGEEGGKNTTFSKNENSSVSDYQYSGRSGFDTNATSVTYTGDANVIIAASSGTNVTGGHLWFNKQQQGVFTTSAINLYGAKKVNFSFNRSKGLTIVSYKFNEADEWTQLWKDTNQNAKTNQNQDITTDGEAVIFIKIQEGNNSNNLRVDDLKLTVVEAGEDGKTPTSLAWSDDEVECTLGTTAVLPTLTTDPFGLAGVEYASSNESVAIIDANGNVTLVGDGTTIITASFGGNDTYSQAAPASYTLHVIDPNLFSNVITDEILGGSYGLYNTIENGVTYYAYASKQSAIQFNNSSSRSCGFFMGSNAYGHKVKKVSVDYLLGTAGFEVYGKNEPYTAIADIYSTETQGTLIGTITTEATSLNVTGDYKYIAFKPNANGVVKLKNITVKYSVGTDATECGYFIVTNEAYNSLQGQNVIASDGADWIANDIKLSDTEDYVLDFDVIADKVSYERSISNAEAWHGLYLPFEVEDWSTIATRVIEFKEVVVEGEDAYVVFEDVEEGTALEALKPYLIKPVDGKISVAAEVVELKAAAENCETVTVEGANFSFGGTCVSKTGKHESEFYALKDGVFMRTQSETATLKPFRVFIEITSAAKAPQRINVKVGDSTTGIESVSVNANSTNDVIYNINGVRVEKPTTGVYICNGKKFFVK